MTREEFLSKHWKRYPPAQPSWSDVSYYVSDGGLTGSIICGRLLRSDEGYQLTSGGQAIDVSFPVCDWLEPQGVPFDLSLLRPGDLIAGRISKHKGVLALERVLLLAPGALPNESEFTFERSKQWMDFVAEIRKYFLYHDFIEALTPTLVPSPGTEPFLDPFATTWELGSSKQKFFLPTSPEFHLKKMLAAGWANLYEIKSCFRNGEIGAHHQPEFQMLEWYRAFATLDLIARDVQDLITKLCALFKREIPKFERMSMVEAFAEVFPGFVLRPTTSEEDLRALAEKSSIGTSDDDDFDDLFHRLFLERVEPMLAKREVVILRGYPPSQAALSRLGADGFADRFEVYWRGVELANAFDELNDPTENEKRFAEDARKKLALGKPAVPRDEALVAAVQAGMPPSGGIALGLDRLFMSLFEIEKISATRAFPIVR